MNRFSSDKLLIILVTVAFLMLLGLLVDTLRRNSIKYADYELDTIRSSPHECKAQVTGKYSLLGMAPGLNLEYQFQGKTYGVALKVPRDTFKAHEVGDKITITLAQGKPSLAVVGEIRNERATFAE